MKLPPGPVPVLDLAPADRALLRARAFELLGPLLLGERLSPRDEEELRRIDIVLYGRASGWYDRVPRTLTAGDVGLGHVAAHVTMPGRVVTEPSEALRVAAEQELEQLVRRAGR